MGGSGGYKSRAVCVASASGGCHETQRVVVGKIDTKFPTTEAKDKSQFGMRPEHIINIARYFQYRPDSDSPYPGVGVEGILGNRIAV